MLIKLNIHHQLKFLHILQVKDLFPLGRIKMIIMDNLTERKVQKIVKLPSQSFLHLLYPLSHPSKKNPKVFLRKNFYSKLKNSDIFSPGGAWTARGSRSGVGEYVSKCVVNFLCLNDQAYNCLIHLRDDSTVTQCSVHITQTVRTAQSGIEQIYWHKRRHFNRFLSGDNWQGRICTRVCIAVSCLQAVDSLTETNNGRTDMDKVSSSLAVLAEKSRIKALIWNFTQAEI